MNNTLAAAYKKYLSFDSEDHIKDHFQDFMGALSFLIEQVCNSDAESLKQLLQDEIKKEFFMPPPWLRLIITRSIMCQNPGDKDFFDWASNDLKFFYHPQSPVILELEKKVAELS